LLTIGLGLAFRVPGPPRRRRGRARLRAAPWSNCACLPRYLPPPAPGRLRPVARGGAGPGRAGDPGAAAGRVGGPGSAGAVITARSLSVSVVTAP